MKIKYARYLGDTSASIAKFSISESIILKSMSLCVSIDKNGNILTGNSAYNSYKRDILINNKSNSFVDFTRTLGTDKKYYSTNAKKDFSSGELVAEVLKTLKSFVKEENVNAAVITVPSFCGNNYINAVRKAGYLAGITYIEIVEEAIAIAFNNDIYNFKQND